ncbi:hypothetical protein QBC38DRAFT_488498 [Podospora fimiseda]|uniref:Uncharacterized protein n=1 Tax=Podospora fimiseda TaxID=252190 RepID=A0AAN7BEQ2_9PEZI|nr:hypothetical protein QBC38DRAFT_488498 [Podospora fimiseda]
MKNSPNDPQIFLWSLNNNHTHNESTTHATPKMNPILKSLWATSWFIYQTFYIIYAILIALLALLLMLFFIILTAPYTLFYFSSNWSIRSKHHPAVEVYLNHFERLHPNLIAWIAAGHESVVDQNQRPGGVGGWPHKTNRFCIPLCVVTITHESWSFKQSAGLLGKLEAAGWPRRVVWRFLKDEVEKAGLVTPEEQEAFDKVMGIMNSNQIISTQVLGRVVCWALFHKRSEEDDPGSVRHQMQQQLAGKYVSMTGVPIIPVTKDSISWILQGGAVLVPTKGMKGAMGQLAQALPIWVNITKEKDLEKGIKNCWQVIAEPKVYPWTGK